MENDSIKQYVSNINGYYVKDAEAHESLSSINETLDNTYNKDEVDAIAETKADAGNTLSDYNINDAYTKTEVDTALNGQAQTFNFTHFDSFDKDSITINNSDLSGFSNDSSLTVASNEDGSLCKIYGALYPESSATIQNAFNVSIQTRLRPSSNFTIYPLGIIRRTVSGKEEVRAVAGLVKTTGEINITCTLYQADDFGIYLWPCLYFVKDFGDTSSPDA